MFQEIFNKVAEKSGNVTLTWLGVLPVLVAVSLLVTGIMGGWATHSKAQMAADAGSLAATKKMEEIIIDELTLGLDEDLLPPGVDLGEEFDPDDLDRGELDDHLKKLFRDNETLSAFMSKVMEKHHEEIAAEVEKYVTKNGGDPDGVITYPVDGRIQVEVKKEYEPMGFEEFFEDYYIKGKGSGPHRIYLEFLPKQQFYY